MAIRGVPGSGQTRLARVLIKNLIAEQKRILVLTGDRQSPLTTRLENIAFSLSDERDYNAWLTEQIKQKYLGKLPMDFLPLHLFYPILY